MMSSTEREANSMYLSVSLFLILGCSREFPNTLSRFLSDEFLWPSYKELNISNGDCWKDRHKKGKVNPMCILICIHPPSLYFVKLMQSN